MTHTPTPWRSFPYASTDFGICQDSNDGGSHDIAIVRNKADAAFIAHACNAYDGLVAKLQDAYDMLDNSDVRYLIGNKMGQQAELHRVLNGARAILAKTRDYQ